MSVPPDMCAGELVWIRTAVRRKAVYASPACFYNFRQGGREGRLAAVARVEPWPVSDVIAD